MQSKYFFPGYDEHYESVLPYFDVINVGDAPMTFYDNKSKPVATLYPTHHSSASLYETLSYASYKRSKMINHLVQEPDPRGAEVLTFGYMDRTSKQRFAKLTRPSHNYPDVWKTLAKHMILQSKFFRETQPKFARIHDYIQDHTNPTWKIEHSCFSTISVWKDISTKATSTNKNLAKNSWVAFNAVAPIQGVIGHLVFPKRFTGIPINNSVTVYYSGKEPVYFQANRDRHVRDWFFTQSYLRRNLVACGGVHYELERSEMSGSLYTEDELRFSTKINSHFRVA